MRCQAWPGLQRPRCPTAGVSDITNGDNQLWLQTWRDKQIDFHQTSVNQLLTRFWPSLHLPRASRVFVPLCGKSLDMLWLAQQGHDVIGVELSPVAVRAFFKDNRLQAKKCRVGGFTLWRHGRISILCGDYFALNKTDLGRIDTVYDRAALTALPEELRGQYVAQLQNIVPETATVFLLTTEDAAEDETLAQALGVDEEVKALYSTCFDIDLAHVESVFEADPEAPDAAPRRTEYKVYRISGRMG